MEIIDQALKEGRSVLSEHESKRVLAAYGLPVTREKLVTDIKDLGPALQEIGYPLVIKGCSAEATHKTEKGLIRIDLRNEQDALRAYQEITGAMAEGDTAVLVQEMIHGQRELVIGMTRDPQFGPCVMFGLGGIFTEILEDVSFRVAPVEKPEVLAMMQEIKGRQILGAVRGMEPANLDRLAEMVITVGQIGLDHESVKEIDINPVILCKGEPVAVDALVVLQ
jgi:acetyl-CoA synthetase (ADP-forming)